MITGPTILVVTCVYACGGQKVKFKWLTAALNGLAVF